MLDSLYGDLPPPGGKSSSVSATDSSSTSKAPSLLGALYDDIPDPQANQLVAATAWSAHRAKMLAPPIFRKRETSSVSSQTSSNSAALRASLEHSKQLSSSAEHLPPTSSFATPSSSSFPPFASKLGASAKLGVASSSSHSQHLSLAEEYDPSKPNEYDRILRERQRLKQAEELEKKQLEIERITKERIMREEKWQAQSVTASSSPQPSGGGASHLSLNISGEEAWKRRAMLSNTAGQPPSLGGKGGSSHTSSVNSGNFGVSASMQMGVSPGFSNSSSFSSPQQNMEETSSLGDSKKSVAARMMQKMGWKHGEGLGRDKQGIKAPLVAKKTDKRSGIIVPGAASRADGGGGIIMPPGSVGVVMGDGREGGAASSQQPMGAPVTFNRAPTRILLLTNLVGPGEVDSYLKEETEEEASKYGNLLSVKVFEATGVPDDETVRIFCEYETSSQATKALVTMNGRSFGGRFVKARFYDEDRFSRDDLSPDSD